MTKKCAYRDSWHPPEWTCNADAGEGSLYCKGHREIKTTGSDEMPDKTVKITISGDYGTGKTSIASFIAAQLRKAGVPVGFGWSVDVPIAFDAAVANLKKLGQAGVAVAVETVQIKADR